MSCYFDFVNETKDIGDLAKCYGGTERRSDGATERRSDGRTDTTSYRDAETHLKMGFQKYFHVFESVTQG